MLDGSVADRFLFDALELNRSGHDVIARFFANSVVPVAASAMITA